MLIRVKEKGFELKKIKRTEEKERNDREREKTKKIVKNLRNCLLDHESSMEVGYGFYAIRSKLLIANDMYWVVL